MSNPEVNPAAPVISAPPGAFDPTVTLVKADLVAAADGAITYLASAGEAAKSQTEIVVAQVSTDSEALAFKVAKEHGFEAYLSIFKSSIDAGKVKIEAGLSTEINSLIDKGIAALKALKL